MVVLNLHVPDVDDVEIIHFLFSRSVIAASVNEAVSRLTQTSYFCCSKILLSIFIQIVSDSITPHQT